MKLFYYVLKQISLNEENGCHHLLNKLLIRNPTVHSHSVTNEQTKRIIVICQILIPSLSICLRL